MDLQQYTQLTDSLATLNFTEPSLNLAVATYTSTEPLVDISLGETNDFIVGDWQQLSQLAESVLQPSQGEALPVPPHAPPPTADPLLGVSAEQFTLAAVPNALTQPVNGNFDVYYTFYYVYGNGDYYVGGGYADASLGYTAGQYINPVYDETYYEGFNPGYYYIATVTNLGADYGYQNAVYATHYFDAETASVAAYIYDASFTYNYGIGYNGLGSEVGYVYDYSLTNRDPLFGYGYYEADLTSA